MTATATPSGEHEIAQMWGSGWQRYAFPAVWLIYLAETVSGVRTHSHGLAAVVGYLLVAAFAACYLIALPAGWTGRSRRYWRLYLACVAFTVAECFFAQEHALVFCVYVGVLTVAARVRWAPVAIFVLAAISAFLPPVVGWTDSINWSGGIAVLLVGFAMFGFFEIISANRSLAEARAEVARLAAENERSRIARDLHDLLGHSLTTITVKAGLARRLAERGETERSRVEITEVEALSRRTLGDVRAAVAGHRDVTLTGELATAREVLRAAGVNAELPGSVDVVDPELSELFGWVLREGITNVVRHSRATQLQVTIGPRFIEITDNGRGGTPGPGNGITGLRERLAAVTGSVTAAGSVKGFTLRAEVPEAGTRPTTAGLAGAESTSPVGA